MISNNFPSFSIFNVLFWFKNEIYLQSRNFKLAIGDKFIRVVQVPAKLMYLKKAKMQFLFKTIYSF